MDNMDLGLSDDEDNLDGASQASIAGSEDEDRMLESDVESEEVNDEDEDDASEREVKALEASLEGNPYDYASHLALIGLLQKMGELDRLRLARENMSSKYPLTPDIWLSWLTDEVKLATTKEQKDEVAELCERAVNDYLSVEVWLEYLQFSIGNMGSGKNGADSVRQLFERALTATGLHVTKGAIIWEAFREFESILLLSIDPTKEAERKEQLDRVGNLFRRQLSCPLLNMEKTYKEFESWRKVDGVDSKLDDKNVKDGYERASDKLNARLPFEEKLLSVQNDIELLDAYKAYLIYEKQNGDPARVTVLYDRAVADVSLEPSLWLDYISYVETNIKIDEILDKIFKKAVRNLPWCSKIWQKWMRSYERWGKPVLEVQTMLEDALVAGFQNAEEYRNLWITYLEYLRRRIDQFSEDEEKNLEILRNAFNRACDHLAKSFGMEGDPNCQILQYWARIEALYAKDMEKVRSLWSDILSQGHAASAASWLEYVSLERCYGDTKHLRKLFQKALTAVKDWPESIANSWIDFERDEGSLEQLEQCEAKVKDKLDKVAGERKKTQPVHETSTASSSSLGKRVHKRKVEEGGLWKHLGTSLKKVPKIEAGDAGSKPKIAPPPGYKGSIDDEKMEDDTSHDLDDQITVFVSNLDYSATEEEVREALKPVEPITLFKMINDFKGRSKGYCYVQLSSKEAVEDALKLDRTPIKGRPMFISRCNPSKTGRPVGFKYKCALEKNKLFVKGLPVTTSKEQLEEIFQVYGALKEVRIVTYRNGHSKGLAYVEFEDQDHAAKALLTTDGMKVEDKIISVAISQPPERKKGSDEIEMPGVKSLGGSSSSRTNFGVPKTVLSMVPRNVKTSISNGAPGTSENSMKHPMNNQDFRKMLLEKK